VAQLESINHVSKRAFITDGTVNWESIPSARPISGLPQIFWDDGYPWPEANHWAYERALSIGVKLNTVQSLMAHLHKYASWLETNKFDWRHFPTRKSERVLVLYRGALIEARDSGEISPSTATARMRAVIQFYRHCAIHNFISRDAPKWKDRPVVISYFDNVGFERTLSRITTDISIPNRARPGFKLEDGLLPITSSHMTELLQFTSSNESEELHLMLTLGFFIGARIGTIASLRIENLENALPDSSIVGIENIAVGPGTGVATKFDVSGHLLVPDFLLNELKRYAYSPRRLKREQIASKENKSLLFLTRFGNPYSNPSGLSGSAIAREMTDLRRSAVVAGLKFMKKFHFHQTRATYGTWLMTIALQKIGQKAAIEFVRQAMLHKDEATTMRYITFLEHTKAKIEMGNAFTEAFGGLSTRLGSSNRE
jgi:integrase